MVKAVFTTVLHPTFDKRQRCYLTTLCYPHKGVVKDVLASIQRLGKVVVKDVSDSVQRFDKGACGQTFLRFRFKI